MMHQRGILKAYIFLFACIYGTKFKAIRGDQRQPRSSSTKDDHQSFLYFWHQHPDFPRDCQDIRDQCSNSVGKSSGTYLIKPEGCMKPFEVYCDNDVDSGGWAVVLRRSDGSLSFKRNWEDYKVGFGFLSNEHWLGNEKLSYLTNQAEYELLIDFLLSNGSSFYVKYSSFRISDDWSQYALVSAGMHSGNASLENCPPNMVYKKSTCQLTCEDPTGMNSCSRSNTVEAKACVCADGLLKKGDSCVLPAACGCFITKANLLLSNNETYVNTDCSEKCTCQNNQLICNSNYECSNNSSCTIKNDVRQCYCHEGYKGDGETCVLSYKDCYDAYEAGQRQNGVYTIQPDGWPGSFDVYCDMTTSEGGWTVFQRRVDRVTDFYRNWTSYRNGFGSVQHGRDFWLGNEKLYYLTNFNQRRYRIRVDIVTSEGLPKYDEFATFRIDSEDTKYRLEATYPTRGSASHGIFDLRGRPFSTYDEDNDGCGRHNCAVQHRGAWWYNPGINGRCHACYRRRCKYFQYSSRCSTSCTGSNLNGDYNGDESEFLFFGYNDSFCNLTSSEMKIRPIV